MPTFPIIFTIDGSGRHEVLLIDKSIKLSKLSEIISAVSAQSPNCREYMSKYKSGGEKVAELRVKWSSVGRDPKVWPATTILTEDNIEAAMRMIEDSGVGKDVLEVKMGKEE
ncbi:hypothetical protein NA57DRAFT_50657 [Rhizodiscina lignyota]|uniref:Uncharacterized protein n=1 Tax=Rhizodiscina lignyota TaxID=1504668 RepID=A0A9P4IPN6_9PEZI|nr:hypothetical protein NA57DRAFT_50657 [Rhizodiscina lignyota]